MEGPSGDVFVSFEGLEGSGSLTSGCVETPIPLEDLVVPDVAVDIHVGEGITFERSTVCLGYDEARVRALGLDESELELLHVVDGDVQSITTAVEEDEDRVCGITDSFSPFLVGALRSGERPPAAEPGDHGSNGEPTDPDGEPTGDASEAPAGGDPGDAPTPDTPADATVTRLAGADRIDSSIAISRASFSDGEAGAVVLARADGYVDALAATPLAVAAGGPLLLTPVDALDARVDAELARVLRDGGTVHLVGGDAALAETVEETLEAEGYEVARHGGSDRFATAALVATASGNDGAVFLTTGNDFPDALSAGAAAANEGGVVLLTAGAELPEATDAWLRSQPARPRFAVGGPAARAVPAATPLVGGDRYATALRVVERFFDRAPVIGVASGERFPDALAGGVHAARLGGGLLLTPGAGLPAEVRSYLARPTAPPQRFVYGGSQAVGSAIAEQAGTQG